MHTLNTLVTIWRNLRIKQMNAKLRNLKSKDLKLDASEKAHFFQIFLMKMTEETANFLSENLENVLQPGLNHLHRQGWVVKKVSLAEESVFYTQSGRSLVLLVEKA